MAGQHGPAHRACKRKPAAVRREQRQRADGRRVPALIREVKYLHVHSGGQLSPMRKALLRVRSPTTLQA